MLVDAGLAFGFTLRPVIKATVQAIMFNLVKDGRHQTIYIGIVTLQVAVLYGTRVEHSVNILVQSLREPFTRHIVAT